MAHIATLILLCISGKFLAEGRKVDRVPKYHTCNDTKTLLNEDLCNGVVDCDNGEDEGVDLRAPPLFDPFSEFQRCNNPKNSHNESCVVRRASICAGEFTCSNLTPCDLKCESYYKCEPLAYPKYSDDGPFFSPQFFSQSDLRYFRVENSDECVLRSTICDGYPCDGCAEDHEWGTGHGFKCLRNGRECVLPQQLVHDDIPDCDGGADLCFGAETPLNASSRNERQSLSNLDTQKCFQCLNDVMIIPASRVCDGIMDCSDLSDECLCENGAPGICDQVMEKGSDPMTLHSESSTISSTNIKSCVPGHVMCSSGKCIPRESVCDGIKDCDEDETFEICRGTLRCKDATQFEATCRCDPVLSCIHREGSACNGVADCPVPVREGTETSENTSPEDECEASCNTSSSNFSCKPYVGTEISSSNHGVWCVIPSGIELPDHYTFGTEPGQDCDGVVDCELSASDEEPSVDCTRFHCDAIRPGYVSITEDQVCNGVIDCKDALDESVEFCGTGRFSCPAHGGRKISIHPGLVCDFSITCDDASDEDDCDDGRFYCENGEPLFVRGRQIKDSRGDCSDWSDECPTINQSTMTNAFSSRYQLIENVILRTLVWIMAVLAIAGNMAVLIREVKKLRNETKLTSAIRANRLLILNLASADLLMGIYLLTLAAMTLRFNGVYCSKDLEWRSSSTCISLGIMTVISSETSVITLAMLTGCRLYAVIRPFRSSSIPRKSHLYLMLSSSWVVAFLLAILPLVSSLSHIFVNEKEFAYNPFSRKAPTTLDGTKELFRKLLTYDPNVNVTSDVAESLLSSPTWRDLETAAPAYFAHQYFEPSNYWGYYSAASVCIPKFFITTSDPSWVFSFVVNLFNFMAFTFVATAYTIIYLKSRQDAAIRNRNAKTEQGQLKAMQRKILRLIITDFCCWIPICIMAFCNLAGVDVGNTAYAVSAIVLLPVNSALNPVLYSDVIEEIIKKLFSRPKQRLFSTKKNITSSNRDTASTKVEFNDKKVMQIESMKPSPASSHKSKEFTKV